MNSTSSPSGCTKVIPLEGALVPYYWGMVAPMLEAALDEGGGELDLDVVYKRLGEQYMQLLIAVEHDRILAAFVTEVVNYPKKRALRIVLAGGTGARKWREALREVMHAGAKAIGAQRIEIFGRKGWQKILAAYPTCKVRYYVITEDV